MRPWFPPPPWGEGARTCAKRRRDSGRDGGTTCPGTCGAPVPLASSRHSPATREGATSCAEVESGGWRGRGLCMVYPLVPVPVSRVQEAARHGRRGGLSLGRARG